MTPEQEQRLTAAVEELIQSNRISQEQLNEMRQARIEDRRIQEEQLNEMRQAQAEITRDQQIQINEIREGQAMLAQFFREALDRFEQRTIAFEHRTDQMHQEIQDLRRDFLEFVQKRD